MFKKMMAKIGIGSAKVDLVLHGNEFALGEKIEGELVIEGGAVEQSINKIEVDFVLSVCTKKQEYKQVVTRIPVANSFIIKSSEKRVLPFHFELPEDLLVSSQMITYSFVTNLDIAAGMDKLDHDNIRVNPPVRLQHVIAAMEQLGFREKYDSRSFDGYTQEFEFSPISFFRDQVEEVEFIVALEDNQIRLLLEVDLYSFGRDEVEIKKEITLSNELLANVSQVANYLEEILKEMVQNPHGYLHHRDPHSYGHRKQHHSGFVGALGGAAVGLLGGMVISEVMDDWVEDITSYSGEMLESALGGDNDSGTDDSGEDLGGFFDDMFGGGED